MKSNYWVINKNVTGLPSKDDFTCKEEDLPSCGEGDIIVKAEYLTVDPYMRYRIRTMKPGDCMPGGQVAKVIESGNDDYPVGSYVVSYSGWRTVTHVTKGAMEKAVLVGLPTIMKFPDLGSLPKSLALGALGMPGNTAYFGFLELCSPKSGETVVVNGAAGAVGSLVCQIAKLKGCNVIAFAGTDKKVAWLKELGVDHAFNYKSVSVGETLKQVAPNGIDCYFDNVGGSFTDEVVPQLAIFARIAICGAISIYNDIDESSRRSPYVQPLILWKQLRIEGFIVTRWIKRWEEGLKAMGQWIKEGKLKYRETITEGFENMPEAFVGLFKGDNIGKAIIKV